MAGDPFSSHPYPSMKVIVSAYYHCEDCDKTIRTADKAAHQRGKKHAVKVAEKNGTAGGDLAWAVAPATSDKGCHNCHQLDHVSRDCPQPRADTRECHFCHEVGHAKADCPNKPRNVCFNCGEDGHRKSECPNERQMLCRNCEGPGHVARDCPEPVNPSKVKCNNCEQMGHMMKECPEPKDWSKVKCRTCGNMGHTSARCQGQGEPMASDVSGWDNINGASAAEPWTTDGDTINEPSGSWDDTAVAVEETPTESWDDTAELPAPDSGADDGWETVTANAASVETTNNGWESSTATGSAW